MGIEFERFLALTAALATATAAAAGCAVNDVSDDATGGSTNTGGAEQGGATGSGGAHTGGAPVAGATSAAGAGNVAGSTSAAGAGNVAGSTSVAGSMATAGASNVAGAATVAGASNVAGSTAAAGSTSVAGSPNAGGEGGGTAAPMCVSSGTGDCIGLPDPGDECTADGSDNPVGVACDKSSFKLDAVGHAVMSDCLKEIAGDTCAALDEIEACKDRALTSVCPTDQAVEACAHGLWVESGAGGAGGAPAMEQVLPGILEVCDDGTLTVDACATALSAQPAIQHGVTLGCMDPSDEGFTETCAARLRFCVLY